VRALTWDGVAWSEPVSLTDDQQPDFAPMVAFDGNGHGLVVWERSNLAPEITPSMDITFARSLEIAASAWDGESWSEPVVLTDNDLMDHAPRLAAGSDGTVMALWHTGDGTDIVGTADHPLTLTYALWDGNGWSAPAPALTGLRDVVNSAPPPRPPWSTPRIPMATCPPRPTRSSSTAPTTAPPGASPSA